MTVDPSNQAQADFWTAAGPIWTELKSRFDEQVQEHGNRAIDALSPQPGERVIDVGCGTGSSTLELARRVGDDGRVVGVDISPTMIESASDLGAGVDNVEYRVVDARAEGFDADFDAMFSRFGVMFFSDAASGFANMRTALLPGGRLGFVCWQSPADNPWASVPMRIAREFVELPFGSDPHAPGPFSLADPDRIAEVLASSGFVDADVTGNTRPTRLGADLDDAVDFVSSLAPPVGALRENDPTKYAELRARITEELAQWANPDGVDVPSATWIVTAANPD